MTRYPAIRRAAGLQSATSQMAITTTKNEAGGLLDSCLAFLAESVATDEGGEFWENEWYEILNDLISGYRATGLDAEAAYGRVDAALAKIPELEVLRLKVRGNFWYTYGWEARTRATAPFVPAGGFAKLEDRTSIAKKAFEDAWRLRPSDGLVAMYLVDINKATSGDRADMEQWFDRAMRANGDNANAVSSKLDWLDPRWHGSTPEMIAFGRACRATKNWWAGITIAVVQAHYAYACTLDSAGKTNYLGAPDVWSEIKEVSDEYLAHNPGKDAYRSKYAAIAYMASKFPEAHAQFQILGDRLTTFTSGPYITLEELKRLRDHTASVMPAFTAKGGGAKPLAGWRGYQAKNSDGIWHARFPAVVQPQAEPGILGTPKRNAFRAVAGGTTYAIRIQPVPPNKRAAGPKAFIDAARQAHATEHGGKVVGEHSATLAQTPASEYVIDAPKLKPNVLRTRLAVIGIRLYEVSILGPEAETSGPSADAFFDAFSIDR